MAITTNALGILSTLFPSAEALGRVLTVGRLGVYAPEVHVREVLRDWGGGGAQRSAPLPTFFDELLRACGAKQVSSLDASNYEGADVLHDLNRPCPEALRETFDTVVDAGTLEHVFQVVTALGALMSMVKVGGRLLLFDMPTNNFSGHGFYQLSPIFFSETLSPAYGFRLETLLVGEDRAYSTLREIPTSTLYSGQRIEIVGSKPCFLYVVATKIAPFPGFEKPAMQPDYQVRWKDGSEVPPPAPSPSVLFRRRLANIAPPYFRFSHDRNLRRTMQANQLSRFPLWRKSSKLAP
jgi:hypothetical protein